MRYAALFAIAALLWATSRQALAIPNQQPRFFVGKRLSATGRQLLKQLEDFSDVPYPDADGWSIGYGHYDKSKANLPERVSELEADGMLTQDLVTYERAVNDAINAPLNQNQFDALVLLAYNVGVNALQNSTLVRLINEYKYQAASDEFERWIYSQGVEHPGLIARRETEKRLFLA